MLAMLENVGYLNVSPSILEKIETFRILVNPLLWFLHVDNAACFQSELCS